MKSFHCCWILIAVALETTAAEFPAGVDIADPLLQLGCLDVTKAPYLADPAGNLGFDRSHPACRRRRSRSRTGLLLP